jgi:hypothetical protein
VIFAVGTKEATIMSFIDQAMGTDASCWQLSSDSSRDACGSLIEQGEDQNLFALIDLLGRRLVVGLWLCYLGPIGAGKLEIIE